MLFELILTTLVSLFLGIVILVISTGIKTAIVYHQFKSRTGSLKFVPQLQLLGGHINSLAFKSNLSKHLPELHKKYGKTMLWLYGTQPAAMTIDLDLIKLIACDEGQTHTNRIKMHLPVKEVEFDCIMLAKDEQWRRIRRAIAPALKSNKFKTPNVRREIEDSIEKLINAIETRLNKGGDKFEMDADDFSHRYSLDLVLSCFYKQNNIVDFHANKDKMVEVIDLGLEEGWSSKFIRLGIIIPFFRSIIDWLILNFHPLGVWRRAILEFIKVQTKINFEARKELKELKQRGEPVDEDNFILSDGTKFSRNMIDHVIDQFHDGKLTKEEYFNSTWFLLNAADKTAADAISHTLYQLAIHGDIQKKLRQAIEAEGIESEYLAWVLNESLRVLPPAPIGCSRTIKRDIKIPEGVLPAGTFVCTPSHVIHRLPQYWGPDADEFKPERFAKADQFHPMQFIPFGAGIRMCPGREFALHETKMLLCALLKRYKFECEPKTIIHESPFFIYTIADSPVYLRVTRV